MYKLFAIIISFSSLNSFAFDKNDIIGIWAMLPLKNGIANVVEYKSDGTSIITPFNCAKPDKKNEREHNTYSVKDNLISIQYEDNTNFDLKILELSPLIMEVEQKITDEFSLTFGYLKVKKTSPLCRLYSGPVNELPKTAYKSSDFVPSPIIPPQADIKRYIGKWMQDGKIDIEIAQDKDGQLYLKKDSSENWHYLYNNVHWVNDELHFDTYAYSGKEDLYQHPYHKTQYRSIIKITTDNKMLYSFFLDGERYDYELTKE